MAASASGYANIAPPASTSSDMTDDDNDETGYWSLAKCKRAYLDYLGSKRDEIDEQQQARCYRHGAQWTTQQVEVFNKRKQPVVTYNRLGRKIDAIVGLMEKLKQDPKGYPRNPRQTDEEGAELATAVVRYVIESELKERIFPFAIENGAVDGVGGVEMLLTEGDHGDPDVSFAHIQPDSFFYDPRSYEHDFSDARYMGQGKWLSVEDAKALAPDKAEEIGNNIQSGWNLTSSPDRERRWVIMDLDNKMVRVVDIWYKHKGKWCWCMFTGFMKIDEGEGYFYNERNQSICKYIVFSSFVDQDGDRYGFVRGLRSSQDEINQRRSKGLHELNSRRIKAEDGAFADVELTRREAVRPDGVVIYNKGFEMEFDDATRLGNMEGQLKFLEDAKNEIENFGPNPALIGQGLEYKSGRAINLLQQAGIAELGPFVIGVKNWKLRIYRAVWNAVQRYWQAERWIRVTNDEGLAQSIQVNGVGIDPKTGYPRLENVLGQLDVNFVMDEGPDEVNMMADAYDTLIALSSQGAKVPPEILIELAPVGASTKRKLLAILQKPDPVQEQAKQITLQGEAAKIDKTRSETMLNQSKVQQGNHQLATGVIERQMDAARSAQEHQLKQAEAATKIQSTAAQGHLAAQSEFMKLRSQQAQDQQKLHTDLLGSALKLKQTEEMHRLKMQQMAARPPGGGSAGSP